MASAGPGTGLEYRPLWPPAVAHIDLALRRGLRLSYAAGLFLEELRGTIDGT